MSPSSTPTTDPASRPSSPPSDEPATLGALLARITPDSPEGSVSVEDLLTQIGDRSFMPMVLVVALLLVSPLSAIPFTPTLGCLVIVTLTLQAALGRGHVWLPRLLMRRSLKARSIIRATLWLERPVAWLDRLSRNRLRHLTTTPLNRISHVAILAIALPWPFLELLPMVTSLGAFAVALLALGLVVRDGAFTILGLAYIGGAGFGVVSLWQRIVGG